MRVMPPSKIPIKVILYTLLYGPSVVFLPVATEVE